MKSEPFATEAEMCAAFMQDVRKQGWTPYPETAGYDILLVAHDGTQIGVHAKLKFNMKLLTQLVGDNWQAWQETGPDFRAALVPSGLHETVCAALGIMPIHKYGGEYSYSCHRHHSPWSVCLACENYWKSWHYWNPAKRCELPAYVPDVVAGASGPVQLTEWKIRALRVVATGEVRGHITRDDFKRYHVDPRRWADSGWLVDGDRPGEFRIASPETWAKQHPVVYPQILADIRDWLATSEAVALKPEDALL